jgi:hypothetical protein
MYALLHVYVLAQTPNHARKSRYEDKLHQVREHEIPCSTNTQNGRGYLVCMVKVEEYACFLLATQNAS